MRVDVPFKHIEYTCDLVVRGAAEDQNVVAGLTHDFYRYPARFTPTFAGAEIRGFSKPGDVVLDPFMGGGTTIVEALALGRRAIGSDINSLALNITRAKTTPLTNAEAQEVVSWAEETAAAMSYRYFRTEIDHNLDDVRTTNLQLPRARDLKKSIAITLERLNELPSNKCRLFAKCAILKTAQWALDNRK